jgi:outer membrane protein assembly factor BamA
MEKEGARIGTVRIDARNIFDVSDPRESGALFQLANTLHFRTREGVIREALLFKPGDPVSARVIDETERLLRANRALYDVEILPRAYANGVVDIDVVTKDTWTLDVTGKVSRSGGKNETAFGLKEDNLFGTGTTVGFLRTSDPDRSGWSFEVDTRARSTAGRGSPTRRVASAMEKRGVLPSFVPSTRSTRAGPRGSKRATTSATTPSTTPAKSSRNSATG